MGVIKSNIIQNVENRRKYRNASKFVPAGQSTQLIVGATNDDDLNILTLTEALYNQFKLKRVYYSAYVPIANHPNLPSIPAPPLLREHRLYQADWLLRFYGFKANELLSGANPNFDENLDPKCDWAIRNLHHFPIEINRADYEMLLRIPGIGVKSARRIVAARRFSSLTYDDLKKMGIVLKRAKYFITCKGKYYGVRNMNQHTVKQEIVMNNINKKNPISHEQLSLFSLYPSIFMTMEENIMKITGEF
jgi:predicted DNA-binding helix-hairpin-helix protein